ncbi:MAG: RND family transporter [Flavobacteriaceae bacterium]|tara:strand:+ start:4175 stop:6529 length:2355 start_codon:yes stop_codon:yes gene_type:complete
MEKANNQWVVWTKISKLILNNRFLILTVLTLLTLIWVNQWKHIRFTFTEANLLPDKHEENIRYKDFLEIFGEEGNLLVLAVNDIDFFSQEKLKMWKDLRIEISKFTEIDYVLSLDNLKEIVKNENLRRFEIKSVLKGQKQDTFNIKNLKQKLFLELPFYENLILNKKTGSIRMGIYMDKKIVNTSKRKDFILKKFIPLIKNFEKKNNVKIYKSGMPYIRTLNAQNILDEIGLFVLTALFVTSLIFFMFFKSIRATLISVLVVLVGVAWALGTLGFLEYEITVLTALIPPLIIVIGIPNCIFLINKYQQEVKEHGNQSKSLEQVIIRIGNASLMTNLTTACGFSTFILTDSKLLKEFGIIASLNIIGIYLISITTIPILYSFMKVPNKKHLKHLKNRTIKKFIKILEHIVKQKKINTYLISLTLIILSMIGIYQINISGSMLDDMPKKQDFFKDIVFFDEQFNGIVPLQIIIDTKRKDGVFKLSTLKRLEKIENVIGKIPELSHPNSLTQIVKFAKQAYYNGNPNYFSLPSSMENRFIMSYFKNYTSEGGENFTNNYVDKENKIARITTFMKDISTIRIEEIEKELIREIDKIFPKERYNVNLTGKSLIFLKGTKFLVKNLVISLALAIILISIFMAYMFRSFKMIIISLIPNLLPLLITAGMMGFAGIPLKPSTILVFSIAFGISVDNTIHFLAKYRQELFDSNWKIQQSVYAALKERGVSMFYSSVVLFFGFSVFMISEFGGTVALGGLVSLTLLIAMLSNLILLPSLLISLKRSIFNEKVIK